MKFGFSSSSRTTWAIAVGRAQQHVDGDVVGPGVEQAAEDAGEGEHVVDLVRVVGAAAGHDRGVLLGLGGVDLGVGVGQREDDRLLGHVGDPLGLQDARAADPDEHVRAAQRVAQVTADPARVGDVGQLLHGAAEGVVVGGQAALPVPDDDVADTGSEEQGDDRGPGRAGAGDGELDLGQLLADHAQRVGERGQDHDRGAVLVVVEDRDVEGLPQPPLDLEAARRGDVLEVDAPESRRDHLDRANDLVGVLAGQADRPGVDVGEPLEQRRLALHHGQRRARADVAQPSTAEPSVTTATLLPFTVRR